MKQKALQLNGREEVFNLENIISRSIFEPVNRSKNISRYVANGNFGSVELRVKAEKNGNYKITPKVNMDKTKGNPEVLLEKLQEFRDLLHRHEYDMVNEGINNNRNQINISFSPKEVYILSLEFEVDSLSSYTNSCIN